MKLYLKILLTILYSVGLIYTISFWSVDLFLWITNNILPLEYQNIFISLLYFPGLLYLIYRIWRFKNIDSNAKGNWTLLLFFLGIITMPLYIWKRDDMFIKQNRSLATK